MTNERVSIKLSPEDILREVVEKITPAVFQAAQNKWSGQIVIDIHEGRFQRAKQHLIATL